MLFTLTTCEARSVYTPRPITTSANKFGVHLLLDDGRNHWTVSLWKDHLTHARHIVGEGGFVTQLVRVDDLDATKWQYFFDLCAELHLTPIIRLATTFDRDAGWWRAPEPDSDGNFTDIAQSYADFLVILRWPTEEHFIIVGNEPNHGNEWSGYPDPAAYARFLRDVADALHLADPAARILNAGFDPYTPHTNSQVFVDGMVYMDEETFLDDMVAAYPDVFTHIDAWSSHSYPLGPFVAGPWEQTYQVDLINGAHNVHHQEPPEGIYNRGINGYEWELWKLSTYGVPPLPVFITETGWRHAESSDSVALDSGQGLPDAQTVITYFDLAMHGNKARYPTLPNIGWTPWQTDARVVAVTPFALNGLPREWGHSNWLVLDAQGAVLGYYVGSEP